MFKLLSKACVIVIAGVMIISLSSGQVSASDRATFNVQLREMSRKARSGESATARAYAAERIADMTAGLDVNKVDDENLSALISLLDASEDPVRLWVAVSLGNLGLRAGRAIPRLQELLTG